MAKLSNKMQPFYSEIFLGVIASIWNKISRFGHFLCLHNEDSYPFNINGHFSHFIPRNIKSTESTVKLRKHENANAEQTLHVFFAAFHLGAE